MPPPADNARIKTLFNLVCDLPDAAAQRAALEALGADAATLARVMALLQRDRSDAELPPRWRRWFGRRRRE
ncbi:MAG: hypothetical protein LW847_16225 [Burkholderiales bacterium]|jgi:hypothetical protein|nr:hypothetical protein [Burkholderiales bacterium]